MPKTTAVRTAHLNTRRATNITAPATEYAALFTVMPTLAGGGTEVSTSGTAYARQVAAFGAPASDVISNTAQIAFANATADYGDVVGWGTYDASTAGNLRDFGYLGGVLVPFTALAATEIFTAPGHTFVNGTKVVVTGTALPAGFTEGTQYFVIGASGNTFQLSLTLGGSAVNVTADGAGEIQTDLRRTILTGDRFLFAIGDLKVSEK